MVNNYALRTKHGNVIFQNAHCEECWLGSNGTDLSNADADEIFKHLATVCQTLNLTLDCIYSINHS